jgi:ribosomal-protein-alanine N-acetyltransferase
MFSIIKLAAVTLSERYNPSLFNYFYETFPTGVLVAEKLHKIVGFVIGVKISSETARILMLTVAENHRREGIGSTLLNNLLKELSIQNIKYIELEVSTTNYQAIKFYQRHGFETINVRSNFYQNGEDAYLMKRVL